MKTSLIEKVKRAIFELKDATQILLEEHIKEVPDLIRVDKYIPLVYEMRNQILQILISPTESIEDCNDYKEYSQSEFPDIFQQVLGEFDDALIEFEIKWNYQIEDHVLNQTDFFD